MSAFKTSVIFVVLIYLQFPKIAINQQTNAIKYFINKTQTEIKLFDLETARNGQLQASNLEEFRDLFATAKQLLTQQYYADFKNNLKYMQITGRIQEKISLETPFPCPLNNTRSPEPPSSVHRLRPGDIDIIGAMGDSLTAGNGMMSRFYTQLLIEFRAQTIFGGGLKDWRTYLTLPNILKVFNPNLYGYAVANTLGKFRDARFNVAEAIAISQDMPYMAEVLVKRMQNDPKVNMTQHWKMISIFVGANDICVEMCNYDKFEDFLEDHRKNLYKALTILRDNIPRLIVNVASIPDIGSIIQAIKTPNYCYSLYKVTCPCFVSNSITPKQNQERHKAHDRLREIDVEVASLPEFQLEDFAAVPVNVIGNRSLRKLKNGCEDMRYFAIDCFHFSQYANAAYTNMLWNDMLQVETKPITTAMRPFETFNCPSKEKPYIKTLKN